jgi:hypothetical protein
MPSIHNKLITLAKKGHVEAEKKYKELEHLLMS